MTAACHPVDSGDELGLRTSAVCFREHFLLNFCEGPPLSVILFRRNPPVLRCNNLGCHHSCQQLGAVNGRAGYVRLYIAQEWSLDGISPHPVSFVPYGIRYDDLAFPDVHYLHHDHWSYAVG